METIIIIGIVLVGAVIWAILAAMNSSKTSAKHEEMFNKILSDKKLQPDQIIFTAHNDSRNCISVNENAKKVSFGYEESEQLLIKNYDFSDIVSFEVKVDDKSSRKVSVGGAVVGAALAGGLGALIGSQSGSKKTKVENMHLLITVNSISNPTIKFSILNPSPDGKGWNSDSFMVERAVERAEEWTGIFNVILKRNN
jgi:hypothetical protein